MSSTPGHIPFDQLVELVEGRLTAKEHAQVHVSTCAVCAREVAWLERVIGLMRTDDSVEPPPCVVAHVIDLFRSRMASSPPNRTRRVKAVLRFDSAQLVLPNGRRACPMAERQLPFSAEEFELDLRITPARYTGSLPGDPASQDRSSKERRVMNTAYETEQFEVAATEIDEQESPTKLDQLLEEIGGRYIADLQALSEEFSRFYEAQLALKDERIAELQQRLEAAERERDAREAQMRELRRASARYVADLRALSDRLSQHMDLAEADHQVIEEDRDSP